MQLPSIQFLLWALPLFICIHVVEEFGYPGGFVRWMKSHNARRIKGTFYYVAVNAAAILAGFILALTASGTIAYVAFFWFAAFLATNGLSHVIASAQEKTYCPGSVTGVFLFWPLLIASWLRLSSDGLINSQSLTLNAASGFIVAYFFFSVHRRRKAEQA